MLGDNLKKARIQAGLTQQQVADLLGVDRSAYTYYETGKSDISTQKLKRLSLIFGVSFEELMYDPIGLEFHSENRFFKEKPECKEDNCPAEISPEEYMMLAKIRLIKGIGRGGELDAMLNILTVPVDLIEDTEE